MFFDLELQKEGLLKGGFAAESIAKAVPVGAFARIVLVAEGGPEVFSYETCHEDDDEEEVWEGHSIDVPEDNVLISDSIDGYLVIAKDHLADAGYDFPALAAGSGCCKVTGGTRLIASDGFGNLMCFDTAKGDFVEAKNLLGSFSLVNKDGVPIDVHLDNPAYAFGKLLDRDDLDFDVVGFFNAICNGRGRALTHEEHPSEWERASMFLLRNAIVAAQGGLPELPDTNISLAPEAWSRVTEGLQNETLMEFVRFGDPLKSFFGAMPESMVNTARRGFSLHTNTPLDDVKRAAVDASRFGDVGDFYMMFEDGEAAEVNPDFIRMIEESLSNPAVGMNYRVKDNAMVKYGDLEVLFIKDHASCAIYLSVNALDEELQPKGELLAAPGL